MTTKTRKSDEFEWDSRYEVFEYVNHAFDVTKAKELIRQKPRKVGVMNISGLVGIIGSPPVEGGPMHLRVVTIDWNKAQSDAVDLEIHCILVPWRDSALPIDGWHRLAKAKVTGKTALPYVILTKKELKQIQL